MFETVASANWATGACTRQDTARVGLADAGSGPGPALPERHHVVPNPRPYSGRVSKWSVTRKLAKNSKRLTSLRGELGTLDEQARHLRDDADDMALRAIVAENTAASREARRAREHAEAHRKNRERVVAEIAELERRQDELLDRLTAER